MKRQLVLALACSALAAGPVFAGQSLEEMFANPPDSARPWVYWYFMDGNTTREGMKADLDAMKEAGIGGVLILEIGAGRPPRGPVEFLSPKWLELFGYAIAEADRLGIEVAVGTGPGWCGAGGKSVKPDDAMQHTVADKNSCASMSSLLVASGAIMPWAVSSRTGTDMPLMDSVE